VAKKKRKPRTPPPPRTQGRSAGSGRKPVQAPQVRKKQRDPAARERTVRYGLYGTAALIIIGTAAAMIAIFAGGGNSANSSSLSVDFSKLPGITHSRPPWQAEINNLALRLPLLGLKPLSAAGTVIHIHQHLAIFDNGKPVVVPKEIGIDDSQFLTELHTHDTSGVMHVESDTNRVYSLGQFFGVWGVFLSKRCVGGLCQKPGSPLRFYVNGLPFTGDPVTMVLKEHQQISIVYGKPPTHIPTTYDFAARGL
jgi:hypothetical protein